MSSSHPTTNPRTVRYSRTSLPPNTGKDSHPFAPPPWRDRRHSSPSTLLHTLSQRNGDTDAPMVLSSPPVTYKDSTGTPSPLPQWPSYTDGLDDVLPCPLGDLLCSLWPTGRDSKPPPRTKVDIGVACSLYPGRYVDYRRPCHGPDSLLEEVRHRTEYWTLLRPPPPP